MVGNENKFAYERLKNDYNFNSYPTVFFDGGYKVDLNATKNSYENSIIECMVRNKTSLPVGVNATWIECPCQQGLFIEMAIKNNYNKTYNGILKVYITEVNSRWHDYYALQYHFGFLEFAFVRNISILPKDEVIIPIT